tara:strand:- start:179 stop:940 length:762 start_codon:yes stop_codon:yes gene_type:complete
MNNSKVIFARESVNKFYDDTSPEVWKKVIGEDLHYHIGWGDGDIFYNSIKYLYKFIPKKSTVLDCGCGWGGTGKVIKRDLECKTTGVTISKTQFDYIKNNNLFDVFHNDLHEFIPNKQYDICLFIESFCHLENPLKVISNLSNSTNKIILREYHLKSSIHHKKYSDAWMMNMYGKNIIISMFNDYGFNLTYEDEHYDYGLEPTLDLWLSNLKNIDKKDKTPHIRTLEISAKYLKKNLKNILNDIGLSTLVFEK